MALAVDARTRAASARAGYVGRTKLLGYALLAPAVLYILALVAVPFGLALYYSLSSATVSDLTGQFVGLQNFVQLLVDPQFQQALKNTIIYAVCSAVGSSILGTALAFILLTPFRGRRVMRYLVLLPWTIPIALTIQAWKWMYHPQYSVLNWIGKHLHLLSSPYGIQWLGQPVPAITAVVMTNVWRNFPFSAVILLAGLTSIPHEIIEAARLDGASWWTRYRKIIVPMIAPILFIGLLFNLVFNLTDLTIIYLLTQGGPGTATEVLSTYAFKVGISAGQLGRGAAITLFLFPVLLVCSIVFLRNIRAREV